MAMRLSKDFKANRALLGDLGQIMSNKTIFNLFKIYITLRLNTKILDNYNVMTTHKNN